MDDDHVAEETAGCTNMKIDWHKTIVVYLGGLLTGLVLILYPALGPIFTSKDQFGFSTAQFGHIFIPQVAFAILVSVGASFLVSRKGIKYILLAGLLALTVSTLLLFVSHYFVHDPAAALGIILSGTCALGVGFGLVITVLNPMASGLFPNNALAAISGLHFALGLGTAGAPLLVGMVRNPDVWWYLPLIVLALGIVELVLAFLLSLEKSDRLSVPKHFKTPPRLWGFVLIVTLYGLCEGTFGSFGSIFLQKQGLSEKSAAGGLALFWGGLALGRILFGLLSVKFSMNWFYKFAPLAVAVLLVVMPLEKTTGASLLLMTVSGLMMSALFPGSVSWSTGEYQKEAILVSGLMVAALELGTGISTNFLGLLSKTYSLRVLFEVIGSAAFLLFVLIWIMGRTPVKRTAPAN